MNLDPLFLKHCRYFFGILSGPLPKSAEKEESIRASAIQFALTGLAELNALDALTEEEKKHITTFILSLYLPGRSSHIPGASDTATGFRASTLLGHPFRTSTVCPTLVVRDFFFSLIIELFRPLAYPFYVFN